MWRKLVYNFVLKATDWYFRVSSIERFLIRSGFLVICAVFGSPIIFEIVLRITGIVLPESYQHLQILDGISTSILIICAFTILLGLAIAVSRFLIENSASSRKRVIVVESRGLRDDDGSPLVDAIPKNIPGQRVPILMDLRNRTDGKVVFPEQAIREILTTHQSIAQHQRQIDGKDLKIMYGGLAPVPYTFLAGVIFDDEREILTYDWDRVQESWRPVNGVDDGATLEVTGVDEISNSDQVVLALAFSYPIADSDLQTTFAAPIVRLTLEGMSSDAHWSDKKQNRLSQQFLEVIKKLASLGVNTIHLVMAAPNSVVFTFGRRYDKRNLPNIVLYQYERGKIPAYPWGISMPVGGVDEPNIIYN